MADESLQALQRCSLQWEASLTSRFRPCGGRPECRARTRFATNPSRADTFRRSRNRVTGCGLPAPPAVMSRWHGLVEYQDSRFDFASTDASPCSIRPAPTRADAAASIPWTQARPESSCKPGQQALHSPWSASSHRRFCGQVPCGPSVARCRAKHRSVAELLTRARPPSPRGPQRHGQSSQHPWTESTGYEGDLRPDVGLLDLRSVFLYARPALFREWLGVGRPPPKARVSRRPTLRLRFPTARS